MILIYIMLYTSIFLHELMHFTLAKSLRIPIIEVKIGTDWPQIKVGKWSISPVIGNSYVEVDYNNLMKLSIVKISFFFMAGILMNFFLATVFFALNKYMEMFSYKIISLSNLVIAIFNLLPLGHTDIVELITIVDERKKILENKCK